MYCYLSLAWFVVSYIRLYDTKTYICMLTNVISLYMLFYRSMFCNIAAYHITSYVVIMVHCFFMVLHYVVLKFIISFSIACLTASHCSIVHSITVFHITFYCILA